MAKSQHLTMGAIILLLIVSPLEDIILLAYFGTSAIPIIIILWILAYQMSKKK